VVREFLAVLLREPKSPPLGILTDLNDAWTLLCLTKADDTKNTISALHANAATAASIINQFIAGLSRSEDTGPLLQRQAGQSNKQPLPELPKQLVDMQSKLVGTEDLGIDSMSDDGAVLCMVRERRAQQWLSCGENYQPIPTGFEGMYL